MKKTLQPLAKTLASAAALLVFAGLSVQADTVYVTAFGSGGVSSTTLTPCAPGVGVASLCLSPLSLGGSISTFGSTTVATPPGAPAHYKCIYGYTNATSMGTVSWSIQPAPLMGTAYALYTAHNNASSTTSNALVTIFSPDITCSSSFTNTPVFQKAYGSNDWCFIGYFTNNSGVTQPTLTFYHSGGNIDNGGNPGNRLCIDCFMIKSIDPCLGVAPTPGVVGPLVAGATSVKVSGVVAGASEVDVYVGDTLLVGQLTSGITAGTVTVPVNPPLAAGQNVTAKQIVGTCIGDPSNPAIVGSGPNPTLQVALQVGKNAALTGPIGAAAPDGGNPQYWIHADSRRTGGYLTGPNNALVVTPSANWVTLVFNQDTDATYDWMNNVGPYTNTDNFGVLQGLALAIDNTTPDIGPFQIYIDSIYNGTNLIQGFEASQYGTSYSNYQYGVMFLRPGASGNTSKYMYSQPDTNYVNNVGGVNADTGTNSLFVNWAFNSTDINSWINLYCGGSGTPYPQIDLSQPISIRMLVLPVGQTVGRKFNGNVSFINNSQDGFWNTGSPTLSVNVTGTGTYTYQWSYNNTDIPGANSSSYTLQSGTGITTNDAGFYLVKVTDEGGGTIARGINIRPSQITDPLPTITTQPATAIVQPSTPVSLTVAATGHVPAGNPLAYQWYHNGVAVGADSSAYAIASAQASDVGNYQVVITNNYGAVTSQVAVLGVVSGSLGTGTGLRGEYYTSETNGVNNFVGAPTLTRTDAAVNFSWGNGSPAASISSDYFMVRWTGQIQPINTDTYTFITTSDDGVRLWVNGQQVINHWNAHSPATDIGSIALTAGQKYDLMLEYFEQTGGATMQLMWSNATAGLPQMAIPQSQLSPATATAIPTIASIASANTLTLSWPMGTYTLQGATNVTGPFTNVAVGVSSPYNIPITTNPKMFYRLQVK